MENFIDLNALERSTKKLNLYKKEEDLSFEDLKVSFNKINYHYQTKNSLKIMELEEELLKKFKVISRTHHNDLMIVNKIIEGYKETQKQVSSMMEQIDTE